MGFVCHKTVLVSASLIGMAFLAPAAARGAEARIWQTVKSTHFIIQHIADETLAKSVAEKAESYYDTIAADVGYTRHQNFWLWDNRVKIVIYPSAQAFTDACGAPGWADGRASYERHEIAGYSQHATKFQSDVLPHEMAHLVLSDFIGQSRVPLWLTEGFAQWEQHGRKQTPPGTARRFLLKDLVTADIRRDADIERVAVFYAQSSSVVGFMIKTYGGERFGKLCQGLRDGKAIDPALAAAYPDDLPSLAELERKWLASLL